MSLPCFSDRSVIYVMEYMHVSISAEHLNFILRYKMTSASYENSCVRESLLTLRTWKLPYLKQRREYR